MLERLHENIELIGESHVKEALLNDSFANIKSERIDTGLNFISADGATINILVTTRTVLHPETPGEFTDQEKAKIISLSIIDNRIAYAAYVVINSNGTLNGEIKWHKLT